MSVKDQRPYVTTICVTYSIYKGPSDLRSTFLRVCHFVVTVHVTTLTCQW